MFPRLSDRQARKLLRNWHYEDSTICRLEIGEAGVINFILQRTISFSFKFHSCQLIILMNSRSQWGLLPSSHGFFLYL